MTELVELAKEILSFRPAGHMSGDKLLELVNHQNMRRFNIAFTLDKRHSIKLREDP